MNTQDVEQQLSDAGCDGVTVEHIGRDVRVGFMLGETPYQVSFRPCHQPMMRDRVSQVARRIGNLRDSVKNK